MSLPIFSPLQVNEELLESYHLEYLPIIELDKGPIEFLITGNEYFINFSATTLYLQANITKADGSAYPAETSSAKQEVAFKNNTLHTLFSDVLVKFNETLVEGGEAFYPLKSYINTLFSFSDTTMDRQLFSSGFVKDDASAMDAITNKGYITRKAWSVTKRNFMVNYM